jgi:thiosulfate/3-mercaptopyruvate sulfurtransferase
MSWMRTGFAFLVAAMLLLAPAVAAGPATLVDAAWLRASLGRPELLLLDASMTPVHRKGHIPGAVSADLFAAGPRELPDAAMQTRMQSWGLSEDRLVVLYDGGASFEATRLHFELLHRGFPAARLRILDGGLAKWQAEGGAVTADATPAPPPGAFRITQRREDIRVRLEEFLAASGDPANHALVEALDADWHYGAAPFFDRPGHVPHAIMLPPEDFFGPDKTFKKPDEIARMLAHLGIRREQQVLTHCGGGWAASVPFFALRELLGWPRVRLFQESQLGWLRDPRQLPMWTYDAPQLVRDIAWVKTWAGRRFRGFGIAEASVIDLRPPEAFRQGHVPFAVNLPAATFRQHAGDPAALAAVLGAAGLNPAHELVLMAEGGLTPDMALAFAALERLGAQRVSVLLDGPDRWAEQGQEIVRDATPAPRATSFPVRPAAAPRALYPALAVHFGSQPPAGGGAHVPYAALLQPDGRPLPAKDLWKAFEKAGVARYASLVARADESGEAAVGYLLLRLMGFPDVSLSAAAARP